MGGGGGVVILGQAICAWLDPPVDEMKRDVEPPVHDAVVRGNPKKSRVVDGRGSSIVGGCRLEQDLRGERGELQLLSPVVTPSASSVNMHIRDRYIIFEADAHRYILHPGTDMQAVFPISVSGLWAKYFKEFDAVAVTTQWFGKWAGNPCSDYFAVIQEYREKGETDEQIAQRIRDAWRDKGLIASAAGTRMHRNIGTSN